MSLLYIDCTLNSSLSAAAAAAVTTTSIAFLLFCWSFCVYILYTPPLIRYYIKSTYLQWRTSKPTYLHHKLSHYLPPPPPPSIFSSVWVLFPYLILVPSTLSPSSSSLLFLHLLDACTITLKGGLNLLSPETICFPLPLSLSLFLLRCPRPSSYMESSLA